MKDVEEQRARASCRAHPSHSPAFLQVCCSSDRCIPTPTTEVEGSAYLHSGVALHEAQDGGERCWDAVSRR